MTRFPVNSAGLVPLVAASQAIAPFTYENGLKLDAQGRVVVVG